MRPDSALSLKRERFRFGGEDYKYLAHRSTVRNERAVEVPIALRVVRNMMSRMADARILEVGNVLHQYGYSMSRTVVDLTEKKPWVVNDDIVDHKGGPYHLIVSVSTFEHVGMTGCDDPNKSVRAVLHCIKMLAKGGVFFFTVPIGYNPLLDQYLMRQWSEDCRYMVRLTRSNLWAEADREVVEHARFNLPYKKANAIIVCRISGIR